ncbi:MAG: antitoxin VapB family protein [Promethearchaeia archaeon]
MASITIKINKKIYEKLLEIKKDNEDISDVIGRLLDIKEKPKNIKKFFGVWKDLPDEYFEIINSAFKEIREDINRRFSF